jgi:hypothetical protein
MKIRVQVVTVFSIVQAKRQLLTCLSTQIVNSLKNTFIFGLPRTFTNDRENESFHTYFVFRMDRL